MATPVWVLRGNALPVTAATQPSVGLRLTESLSKARVANDKPPRGRTGGRALAGHQGAVVPTVDGMGGRPAHAHGVPRRRRSARIDRVRAGRSRAADHRV